MRSKAFMIQFMTVLATVLLMCFSFTNPGIAGATFKEDQLKYQRVRTAYAEKEDEIKKLFAEKKLPYPPEKIFIRVFKKENVLELWAHSKQDSRFHLVKEYEVCSHSGKEKPASGRLGPKRQQGDGQIPEGFYHVDRFNPASRFYLSLGLNYPNRSDRILGKKGKLGGEIFIHGNCVTIGCIPITNDKIMELYMVAVEARSKGQRRIPVHIFPARLNDEGMAKLKKDFPNNPELISFWDNIKPGFDYFEQNQRLPRVMVVGNGRYLLPKPVPWKELTPGLHLAELKSPQKSPVCNYPITVLKIDPKIYGLKLISASEHGGKSKTAKAWADEFGLTAAINASMYGQDHKTSTGYMKNFEHVNKSGINSKFGAFMAFNPVSGSVPPVQVIDRYNQDWKSLIKKYNTVIQNYRMISLKRNNVWKQSEEIYSIATIAIDKDGNILFIHSRTPFSVHDFNHILLKLPLNIKNAMYVEGGPEATLFVNAGGKEQGWVGHYETDFAEHDDNKSPWQIPNVIGVVKRK